MPTRFPLLLLIASSGALVCACAPSGLHDAETARLAQLEDREQIRQLLVDYGATLDRRDFTAFGALFAADAEYAGGGAPVHGRASIQAQLEGIIGSNPSGLPAPNFHLSFNPSITLDGDHATAVSLGAYTAPDAASGSTHMVFFVWYQDELVREDGRWLFQRRAVGSGALPAAIPPPPSPAGAPERLQ